MTYAEDLEKRNEALESTLIDLEEQIIDLIKKRWGRGFGGLL